MAIRTDDVVVPSVDVVTREIESELIIIPPVAGVAEVEAEDELYTLNDTGKAIWDLLDGRSLGDVVAALIRQYDAPPGDIERDVLSLVDELLEGRIVQVISTAPDC